MKGEAPRVVISQPWPTSVMKAPIWDTTDAIHSQRNSGWRSGDQAEVAGSGTAVEIVGLTRTRLAFETQVL